MQVSDINLKTKYSFGSFDFPSHLENLRSMTYKSMTSPSARKMSAYNIITISFPAMSLIENKEEFGLIQKGIL